MASEEEQKTWRPFYHCPKCSYPIYCDCPTCIKYVPEGIIPQKRSECPNPDCDFQPPDGWWMDYEWDLAIMRGADAFYDKWYSCCDGIVNLPFKSAPYNPEDWDGCEIQYA